MILSWNTTKKCNLFCKHCYRDSGPEVESTNELNTEEGKKLIDTIKSAGFKILILSGGEPLLREDIFELAFYASKSGLRPALGSNGTLITPQVAEKLVKSGLSTVSISLDSLQCEYHDKFRNATGAWKKAVFGIENAIAAGLKVQVNTTLTENNFDQFDDIVNFVVELGVNALHPFFLVPTGRGKEIEEDSLKMEKYFQMIQKVLEKQETHSIELKPTCAPQFIGVARDMNISMRFTRGCIAGISYCCILPDGDVHICPYLPVKVGNIREKPFDDIWAQSDIFKKLRNFEEYEGRCGQCSRINICGGCRARAYHYNGNFMAEDPWCNINLRV